MRIVVLCEGASEEVLRKPLTDFMNGRRPEGLRTGIKIVKYGGHVRQSKVPRIVRGCADERDVIGVVILTDVRPLFRDAAEATEAVLSMLNEVKISKPIHVRVAQFELEAWLLPFWDEMATALRVRNQRPDGNPESVDGDHPPSERLKELYRLSKDKREYEKIIDAKKWLTAARIEAAARECPQLKMFLNSLLEFAGAPLLS